METSTPIHGPGKSTDPEFVAPQFTPLRRGRNRNRPVQEVEALEVVNEERERTERRRTVEIRRSIASLQNESTTSLNDTLNNLSNADLKSQLEIICKLNTENKIGAKNAWCLRVIDILKRMVNNNSEDVVKIAGNSIEIAGKVYALRIDDIHSQGVKMVGSLARNFANRSNKTQNNEDADNPDAEHYPEDLESIKKLARKKKLVNKSHIIAADPKKFLCKLPKLESAVFSARTDANVGAVANLFTNRYRMTPSGDTFLFMTKEKAYDFTPGIDQSVNPATNKTYPLNVKSVNHLNLCASFKDFRIDNWSVDENYDRSFRNTNIADELVLNDEGLPIVELDGSLHDLFENRDSDGDEDVDQAMPPPNSQLNNLEYIDSFYPHSLSNRAPSAQSAYSFNNLVQTPSGMVDQIWAGPNHWKFKHIRRAPVAYTGKENTPQISKKKRQKREYFAEIDLNHIELPELLPSTGAIRKKVKLHKREDMLLPMKDLLAEKFVEELDYLKMIPYKRCNDLNQSIEVDNENAAYNYDNQNDAGYCPDMLANDDNNGSDNEDIATADTDNSGSEAAALPQVENFTRANLIAAPEMVNHDIIHYATKAKKMDIKKLKEKTWNIITHQTENNERAQVVPTKFSELYAELPGKLPTEMSKNLSPHLAFTSVLYLGNEKNLSLKPSRDNRDFYIYGPK